MTATCCCILPWTVDYNKKTRILNIFRCELNSLPTQVWCPSFVEGELLSIAGNLPSTYNFTRTECFKHVQHATKAVNLALLCDGRLGSLKQYEMMTVKPKTRHGKIFTNNYTNNWVLPITDQITIRVGTSLKGVKSRRSFTACQIRLENRRV